jgi:Response regulators consisting of a CheY-like receiver domain and a winged-helix DNA-binding domain
MATVGGLPEGHMQRILVVDDDPTVTNVLRRGLSYEGYRVDTAATGRQALTMARDHTPDLVILDLMLPGLDGYDVLERLRLVDANLPVMMLTARDGAADQVKGLELGADDYVVKPFRFEVLSARVKALLRRCEQDRPEVMRFDDLSLDTGTRRAQRGERMIDLTSTEYELLRQFLLHPRRVVAKHVLMERVWGFEVEGSSNIVEVYVKQLRQKLEANGEPRLIHTFRGAGYALREP